MTVRDTVVAVDPVTAGRDMYDLIAELYPICRSITGEGFRSTSTSWPSTSTWPSTR